MLSKPVNLAVVDDHALFRKVLKNYLSEQRNLLVVAQASDITDLFAKLRHVHVDLLVMDIFMPGANGVSALRQIKSEFPDIRIVVLSMCTDVGLVSDLLDGGIHAYICKADEPEELLHAIEAAAEDRIYRNKILTEALYLDKQNDLYAEADGSKVSLSDREKRMLQLLWEEKSNKEIANEFFLGVRSVEKIRQDMKEKIGTRSTVGLLKYAIANRIISTHVNSPEPIERAS